MAQSMHHQEFESHRRRMYGLAYRMLGSQADAQDIVQDAWLRWHAVDFSEVRCASAFLTRIVTHLCLDHIKSAHANRELYVGAWLPEPLIEGEADACPGPEAQLERMGEVSYAFMLSLERLTALERAAFLLHEVFDVDYKDIAQTLQRSEATCRQLVVRARAQLNTPGQRQVAAPRDVNALMSAFFSALQEGSPDRLAALLSEDVCYVADGGGKVNVANKAVHGRRAVSRLLMGLMQKMPTTHALKPARINEENGLIVLDAQGGLVAAVMFDAEADGAIRGVYAMCNPDKLRVASSI